MPRYNNLNYEYLNYLFFAFFDNKKKKWLLYVFPDFLHHNIYF